MQYVSATDAKQTFSAVLDTAQREPVIIRKQNRDVAVMISMRDFERLRRVNIEEFQKFCDRLGQNAAARGLTEEKLNEILASDS
ncbi:MAG TPA: type II toxin-antitoxin system Phd/YefM family antitoxin [Ktedonobacteraceae bacterium]|nr:type II toxin-antitoxin system Phd/YefM family antitoxin [Ktedonobacteraceae bacterium]